MSPLFRKKETYNEQMLREAGLDRVVFTDPSPPPENPPPFDTAKMPILPYGPGGRPVYVETGPMPWDVVTTATVPAVVGDTVEFVTLPGGDVIVEKEEGDGDLSPLADAVEEHLSPPYRAAAARQDGDLWGVGAKRIDVATIPFPAADALELSQTGGVTEFRVDGEPSEVAAPVELQRLGEREEGDFCVEARRIDGDDWEVEVSPL